MSLIVNPRVASILRAAKAHDIQAGLHGPWEVKKLNLAHSVPVTLPNGKKAVHEAGRFTQLWRYTLSPQEKEIVMVDNWDELKTHLEFMLRAWGNVLITGLGLGCVARGCLSKLEVKKVTVIERDPRVVALCAAKYHWATHPKLQIIVADALDYCEHVKPGQYDCAWHDLWSDPDQGEQHLSLSHSKLLLKLHSKVQLQGAWAFPRRERRLWRRATQGAVL